MRQAFPPAARSNEQSRTEMPHFDNLSAEVLEQIRLFVEEIDIDVIDDEVR